MWRGRLVSLEWAMCEGLAGIFVTWVRISILLIIETIDPVVWMALSGGHGDVGKTQSVVAKGM